MVVGGQTQGRSFGFCSSSTKTPLRQAFRIVIALSDSTDYRFDGVVGYRICLTHRRPPVRARVEPFSSHNGGW